MLDLSKYKMTCPFPSMLAFGSREDFHIARRAWRAQKRDLEVQFRKDLQAVLGLSDHPKGELLVRLAWDHGHSYGLQEVVNEAEELAELLQ